MSQLFSARRQFLAQSAIAAAMFTTPGLFAAELAVTAGMMEGPFYPDKLPLDTDNDLLIINDAITPAVGEITHLTGKVLDAAGNPIRNAFIEIWQVDSRGAYLHGGSDNGDRRDKNFQGYGRFLTDSKGQYYFRTIKPVAYPGRTPHIHVGISRGGKRVFTSQLFIEGEAGNARDGLYRSLNAAGQKNHHGPLRAHQGIEDRRARRQLRHRPGPHRDRTGRRRTERRRQIRSRQRWRSATTPTVAQSFHD